MTMQPQVNIKHNYYATLLQLVRGPCYARQPTAQLASKTITNNNTDRYLHCRCRLASPGESPSPSDRTSPGGYLPSHPPHLIRHLLVSHPPQSPSPSDRTSPGESPSPSDRTSPGESPSPSDRTSPGGYLPSHPPHLIRHLLVSHPPQSPSPSDRTSPGESPSPSDRTSPGESPSPSDRTLIDAVKSEGVFLTTVNS